MQRGFTYIELLTAVVIIAVLFVPIMQLFSHSLYSTVSSQDFITALNLAEWQMERTKNLNLTKDQLIGTGSQVYPSLDDEPLRMNDAYWRIEKKIIESGDGPLEVRVSVSHDGRMNEPLITLVTLMEDMTWEKMEPVK